MERKIAELHGVRDVSVTYATKQLRIAADDPDALMDEIGAICTAIEPDVRVVKAKAAIKKTAAAAGEKDNGAERSSIFFFEGRQKYFILGLGVIFFLLGIVTRQDIVVSLSCYLAAFLLFGRDVLLKAAKNIAGGQIFDENFLMSVASLGAFCIGEYSEAVAIVMFFFIGELFEDRAVARSRSQIMEVVDLRPETVLLVRGEETAEIPAADAAVGDIVLVRAGDRIPLDGVVVEGESSIDTSPVTGESLPVVVDAGGEVLSGCVNMSGVLKIRVEKVLGESMVSRILRAVENAAAGKPQIDRFITRFARYYTPCVVSLALLTAVIPSLIGGNWYQWIHTALTFLVISCPCALVLSVPLAYFSGIGIGSKHGILFKGGVALEALNKVGAVVMDKTGTVTKGNFSVTEIRAEAGFAEEEVLAFAAAAEKLSVHPIARSIQEAARFRSLKIAAAEDVREIVGRGIAAKVDGKTVLCGNAVFMAENGVGFSASGGEDYGTEVFVAADGRAAGRLLIADEIKADAVSAVSAMADRGIVTAMLTGDREETAAAVSAKVGIDEYRAGLMPQDKLTALREIREEHGGVMFVGDGINDAPVLAGADVGAAMGSGADAAIEAADVVFMNSEMNAIPLSLRIAKKVGHVATENVVFALAVKFLVMVLGFAGYANMWFAIFADTGVTVICILNAVRMLYTDLRRIF